MDSTLLAVVVAVIVGGVGSLGVPALVARIPPYVPQEDTDESSERGSEVDATLDATPAEPSSPPEPPEPYADIARLPGLAWKSAVVGALAGVGVGVAVGWTWALVLWVPFIPVAVALGLVDWRTRLLPTAVLKPAYVGWIVLALTGWAVTGDTHAVIGAAWGWLVAGGMFVVLWFIYPRGLGFGDVRLAGLLGIGLGWVGWGALLVGVYSGFLLGGVIGALLSILKIVERKGVPFGPFMLLGALIGLLWGNALWSALTAG